MAVPTPPQMETPTATLETQIYKCRCLGLDPNPPQTGTCVHLCVVEVVTEIPGARVLQVGQQLTENKVSHFLLLKN